MTLRIPRRLSLLIDLGTRSSRLSNERKSMLDVDYHCGIDDDRFASASHATRDVFLTTWLWYFSLLRTAELFAGESWQGISVERPQIMAKSKNHTAHNQTYKWHKNGIKKPTKQKYTSLKGVSFAWRLCMRPKFDDFLSLSCLSITPRAIIHHKISPDKVFYP